MNEHIVRYAGKSSIYNIDFTVNSCTCRYYLAYAICAHIVVACELYERALNSNITKRNYVYRNKRGKKPAARPALQYLLTVPVTSAQAQANENEESNEKETGEDEECGAAH